MGRLRRVEGQWPTIPALRPGLVNAPSAALSLQHFLRKDPAYAVHFSALHALGFGAYRGHAGFPKCTGLVLDSFTHGDRVYFNTAFPGENRPCVPCPDRTMISRLPLFPGGPYMGRCPVYV